MVIFFCGVALLLISIFTLYIPERQLIDNQRSATDRTIFEHIKSLDIHYTRGFQDQFNSTVITSDNLVNCLDLRCYNLTLDLMAQSIPVYYQSGHSNQFQYQPYRPNYDTFIAVMIVAILLLLIASLISAWK